MSFARRGRTLGSRLCSGLMLPERQPLSNGIVCVETSSRPYLLIRCPLPPLTYVIVRWSFANKKAGEEIVFIASFLFLSSSHETFVKIKSLFFMRSSCRRIGRFVLLKISFWVKNRAPSKRLGALENKS